MKTKKMMAVVLGIFLMFASYAASNAAALEIGVAWPGKSPMPIEVMEGFEKEFKALAPEAKLDVRKELSDQEFAKIVSEFDKTKDAMVVLRSNGVRWLIKNPTKIPTFIGGCNHPTELGVIENIDAPEGNMTGVTYFVPFETQFEVFGTVLPNIKSVLYLYEKGHATAPLEAAGTQKACAKLGIKYAEAGCESGEEAAKAAAEYAGKVSVIITGTQAKLADSTKAIVAAAGKTPVLAFYDIPVKAGAFAGVAANSVTLGKILAQSVVDVVVKKKPVSAVPVKFDPKPELVINAKTAKGIGLEIPYELLSLAKIIE